MKHKSMTTAVLFAGTIGLLAQGQLYFDNNPYNFWNSIEWGGWVDYKVCVSPGVYVSDPSWSAQLFQVGFGFVGSRIPFYGAEWPGVWDAAGDPLGSRRTLSTPGGVTATLEVAIFDGTGTEVFREPPFTYRPPTQENPGPGDLTMLNFRPTCIPEPSAFALGALVGGLLVFQLRSAPGSSARLATHAPDKPTSP